MSHACAALEVAPVVPRCATVTSSKKLVCLWKEGDWLVLSSHDDNLYAAHGCWLPQCRWRRWRGQLVDGVLLVSLWKVFPGGRFQDEDEHSRSCWTRACSCLL